MPYKAIIFDVDGTLADTERLGHLPACNEAFRQMGLPIHWSWDHFKELVAMIQGNANRLAHELRENFELSENEIKSIVTEFERLKKQIYITNFLPGITLREGVLEFIKRLAFDNRSMAIVSTSHEIQINALLENQLSEYASFFDPVLGKESGRKTGEDGILYSKCLERLGLPADQCLVIEDSEVGLKAALKANLTTVITYNDYTKGENFDGASLVVSSLEALDYGHVINGEFERAVQIN